MAFRGFYEYTVDDRGRVAVPARYRHLFSDGAILTLGPDRSLEVYTPDGYEAMAEVVTAEPATTPKGRDLRRAFYGGSWDAELDRQGRILIPSRLREKAQLNGAVVIWGRGECLDIWNRERWQRKLAEVEKTYEQEMGRAPSSER